MANDHLQSSRAAYGDALVAYALNLAVPDLDAKHLAQDQLLAVQLLAEQAVSVLDCRDPKERWELSQSILLPRADTTAGWCSELRRACGGSLPDADTDDQATAKLLDVVRDIFPVLLLADPRPPRAMTTLAVHPELMMTLAFIELLAALRHDVAFQNLFSGTDIASADLHQIADYIEIATHMALYSGSCEQISLFVVGVSLVLFPIKLTALHAEPALDVCLAYARHGLELARRLADGRAQAPMLVGLSNIDLAEGLDEVDVGVGKLLRANVAAVRVLAPTPRPITAVLVTTSPEQIIVTSPSWTEQDQQRWLSGRKDFNWSAHVEQTRLAFLLSSEAEVAAPFVEVVLWLSPLRTASGGFITPSLPVRPFPSVTITDSFAHRLTHWGVNLKSTNLQHLRLGVDRLLSATSDRVHATDGFIDAVMCWENMFGDTPESSFKICGSIALILEPHDRQARISTYRMLKKLYTTRSQIVHGAKQAGQSINSDRDTAIKVAIGALRALCLHPELLEMKNSSERCEAIMLGLLGIDQQPSAASRA